MKSLKELASVDNIAEELTEEQLLAIGNKVKYGFDEDYNSNREWMRDVKKVLELASLKSSPKNTPLPQSSNVKMPIITKACYEYSSRTYPEIIRDGKVVKTQIVGRDLDGSKAETAQKVQDYMNFQLLVESQDWELEMDRLFTILALVGFICKKTYYDPIRKINKSEICDYEDLIINSKVKSLEDARRVSHVLHMHLNDLVEHARAGIFCKEAVDELVEKHAKEMVSPNIDVIEQHNYLDLDEDGYEEPYIVTIIRDSSEVLRISARYSKDDIDIKNKEVKCIYPIQYFTDYHFLVSPTGKFQSVGFGMMLMHLNDAINTIFNQLIDAGNLANMQGGFIDARLEPIGSGDSSFDPGEFKIMKAAGINVKDGIVPISFREPSQVLFQLLGLLIDTAKDLSSSTEVMSGSSGAENAKTGAVMALQQEGMKIFTAIQKRIYRSLNQEFKKLFRLNSMYLDKIQYITDIDRDIKQSDFDTKSITINPAADPNLSSELKRQNQLSLLMQMGPSLDQTAVVKRVLAEMNVPNPEELMPKQQGQNPEMIKLQAEIEEKGQYLNIKGKELELKEKQMMLDTMKMEAEILKLKTAALKDIADAQSISAGNQMQQAELELDVLQRQIDLNSSQEDKARQDYDMIQQHKMQQSQLDQQVQPSQGATDGQSANPAVGGAPSDPTAAQESPEVPPSV